MSVPNASPGFRGTCHTDLRPVGFVRIGGQIYDAKSIKGFIPRNTVVLVVGRDNEMLIVERLGNPNQDTEEANHTPYVARYFSNSTINPGQTLVDIYQQYEMGKA